MNRSQSGFTLVEMMISITIGLIAMSGILLVFSVSVSSNNDGLKRLKLGQELRTILDVMVRDIRRSGYWQSATGTVSNPYSTLFVSPDATCITYSYDLNGNAAPQNSDRFGFKLISGGVRYRTGGTSCNSLGGGWILISDTSTIQITTLTFGEVITCENLSDDDDDSTCSTAAPNDILSRILNIDVVLAGQLVNDPSVTYSLNDSVTVRNAVPSLNGTF